MATQLTEETLLTNFLLPPASLPSIISLQSFTEFFPDSQQASPLIRAIYRRLQAQRVNITDRVERIILNETKKGEKQTRAIARAKWRENRENIIGDDEILLEETLLGPLSNLPERESHTLESLISEMRQAKEVMENEIQRLKEEEQKELKEIQSIVGSLSDLRYGKLANPQLRQQAIEGCLRLEKICET
ncbi:hypothetical protein K3495_g1471 [Podosphaera aphanis]|nr:hypothetical protein K3495_g1471 [Podosphaera aphanis]